MIRATHLSLKRRTFGRRREARTAALTGTKGTTGSSGSKGTLSSSRTKRLRFSASTKQSIGFAGDLQPHVDAPCQNHKFHVWSELCSSSCPCFRDQHNYANTRKYEDWNHAGSCLNANLNILSLYGNRVQYNICRNLEWQVEQ